MTESQKAEMLKTLAELPKGYVSRKVIRGRETFYHQWKEAGKVKSRYLKAAEVESFREQIRRRHAIQEMLVSAGVDVDKKVRCEADPDFETDVKTGESLRQFAAGVAGWEKRDALASILKYLRGETIDRVMIVYGLRRTGKTTMLKQAILDLSPEEFAKAAYIKVSPTSEMAELGRDMDKLHRVGVKFVFIDEVTLMRDFVSGSALLSDIYAGMQMKVVLSGTDSLGFWLSLKDELYDRAYMVHTTFIPFREHGRLLKTDDVDEYIRYGGTLRMGELNLDDPAAFAADASFRDEETTRRYVDTAIASNIQHSLRFADDGRYFGKLHELYEAGELTNAINRIIEDMNHRFLVEVVTDNMRSLDIVNRDRQTVGVTNEHVAQIMAYLKALDLLTICPIVSADPSVPSEDRIIFTQPGMRFAQAQALVHSLNKDRIFATQTDRERERICAKIESDVMGRMLEDIVLCETIRAIPYKRDKYKQLRVFKLKFDRGEFDMAIHDPERETCRLFEIKHTTERDDSQLRHLLDPDKLAYAERNYGKVLSRTVLYRGKPLARKKCVAYCNVAAFLKGIENEIQ